VYFQIKANTGLEWSNLNLQ